MPKNPNAFEKRIGYHFNDKKLLRQALTHSSYVYEIKTDPSACNERMEFLGDAVLELVISEYLYTSFPDMPEGELTRLRAAIVCETVLVDNARQLGIGDFLILGKGEESTGGRNRSSILADAFEAVAGAVFIDGGLIYAKKFILDNLSDDVENMKTVFKTVDCKSYLQEIIQRDSVIPVEYKIINESGPDHDKHFTVEAVHRGVILGGGGGRSKKEAEQNAAADSLKNMDINT